MPQPPLPPKKYIYVLSVQGLAIDNTILHLNHLTFKQIFHPLLLLLSEMCSCIKNQNYSIFLYLMKNVIFILWTITSANFKSYIQ